jgi:CRISPR/Cas system-associated exonuclease Cas4 (RecB family)
MSVTTISSSGTLFARGEAGETFEDSGYRFQKELLNHLNSGVGNLVRDNRASGVFSPSMFYKCARKAGYARLGAERIDNTPARKKLIFNTGHAIHAMLNKYVEEMYRGYGAAVEVKIAYPDYGIYGETDMVVYLSGPGSQVVHVVDFKTIATDAFQRLRVPQILGEQILPESMSTYVWQLHCYMLATDCPSSTLFYINKNDCTTLEFPVVYSHAIGKKIIEKAKQIDEILSRGDLPERLVDSFCNECQFFQLCEPPGVLPLRR